MTAILAFFEVLFSIVFTALTKLVKTVVLSTALVISLFFGAILLVIHMMQR